jgi:hypothetical protein
VLTMTTLIISLLLLISVVSLQRIEDGEGDVFN